MEPSPLPDAVPPVPLLRVPRRDHLPQLPRLPAGAVAAAKRGEIQAPPLRLGALRVRSAGVPGQTRGGAGDVPAAVQGESHRRITPEIRPGREQAGG